MKYLSLLLAVTVLWACSKNDDTNQEPEPTFMETLVGNYTGNLEELSCSLPQESIQVQSMNASITSKAEDEINIVLSNGSEEFFNFDGVINSDTSFVITAFELSDKTYNGSGKLIDKLEILLGDGCMIFGTEAAVFIFEEN